MSSRTIILSAIAAFTILAVWTIASGKRATVPAEAPSPVETKEQAGGNVTVTITPQELTQGKPIVFQIVFDTHSVDLDFDVSQIAELRDEKGSTYGAPVWSGDPPGGHHRKGTLTFPKSIEKASNVTLTLKDISGIKERTFEWKL